jgi:hypothetical protein
VHYICARCDDSSKLGATKLNKTLFYADLAHYLETGETLTGATYKKLQHGPVPVQASSSISQLEKAGKIVQKTINRYGYKKTEYISLKDPSLNDLEKDEIDLLNVIMDDIINNHTAASISEASHDFVWEAAAMGEEIPMGAYIVSKAGKIESEDKAWADKIVAEQVVASKAASDQVMA